MAENTNRPATKEEERQALAKIRKIVKALGTDSYIGTAFIGAWEIAERNIENDWADSVTGELQVLAQNRDDMQASIRAMQEKITDLERYADRLDVNLKEALLSKDYTDIALQESSKEWQTRVDNLYGQIKRLADEGSVLRAQLVLSERIRAEVEAGKMDPQQLEDLKSQVDDQQTTIGSMTQTIKDLQHKLRTTEIELSTAWVRADTLHISLYKEQRKTAKLKERLAQLAELASMEDE